MELSNKVSKIYRVYVIKNKVMGKSNYYIYVYLDPRKSGQYYYENNEFKFRPFYVGLGKNKRDISHLKEARDFYKYDKNKRNKLNKYKIAILRILDKENIKPIIIRVKEDLSKESAIQEEIKLIAHWGRKSAKDGFLSNMSAGGECPDVCHTIETRKKLNKWWKLIDPNDKEYIVNGLTEICQKKNLNPSKLATVASGINYRHKGWNCYRIEEGNIIIKDKILVSKENHYNKEFGRKVSSANKGRKFTEEHKKALRKPKKGNTLTKTNGSILR